MFPYTGRRYTALLELQYARQRVAQRTNTDDRRRSQSSRMEIDHIQRVCDPQLGQGRIKTRPADPQALHYCCLMLPACCHGERISWRGQAPPLHILATCIGRGTRPGEWRLILTLVVRRATINASRNLEIAGTTNVRGGRSRKVALQQRHSRHIAATERGDHMPGECSRLVVVAL